MYGYVYVTVNTINNRKYVGQHKAEEYDESYLGSGKILRNAIKKYGRDAFVQYFVCSAESKEELDRKERWCIDFYKQELGRQCYNIANGGNGGDVFAYASEDVKQAFVEKMTVINRERCRTEEFRKQASEHGRARYADQAARDLHAEKIKETWNDPKMRAAQSQRLKKIFAEYPKDQSYLYKPCILELCGKSIKFDARKYLVQYVKDKYGLGIGSVLFRKLASAGKDGPGYQPLYKKYGQLAGMKIYYIDSENEGVETTGDECNPVEHEIGTCSKCKAEIEEIVHPD